MENKKVWAQGVHDALVCWRLTFLLRRCSNSFNMELSAKIYLFLHKPVFITSLFTFNWGPTKFIICNFAINYQIFDFSPEITAERAESRGPSSSLTTTTLACCLYWVLGCCSAGHWSFPHSVTSTAQVTHPGPHRPVVTRLLWSLGQHCAGRTGLLIPSYLVWLRITYIISRWPQR